MARMALEIHPLISAFDMIIDRLSALEKTSDLIRNNLQHNERSKLGLVDAQIFDFPFQIIRHANLKYSNLKNQFEEQSAMDFPRALYIEHCFDDCLPSWIWENDYENKVRKLPENIIKGIDLERWLEMEAISREKDADAIKCSQISLESPFEYVQDHLAQNILKHELVCLNQLQNTCFECILTEYGLWIWSSGLNNIVFEKWIKIYDDYIGKLRGRKMTANDTINVYDIDRTDATFFNFWFRNRSVEPTDKMRKKMRDYEFISKVGWKGRYKNHPIMGSYLEEFASFFMKMTGRVPISFQ